MPDAEYVFQDIFEEFQPQIVRYFARLAGEGEAEDLAQETFIKINRGLESFRGDSKLSTWIYSIATNVARDRFRSVSFKHSSVTIKGSVEDLELADKNVWTGEKIRTIDEVTIRKEMNT